MSKKEFLAELKECLEGEIPMEEVRSNVAYYKEYIESKDSEKKALEELGSPRLIARTIISSYQANKGPMAGYYKEQARNEYSQTNHRADGYDTNEGDVFMFNGRELKWYEKVLMALIALVLFFVVLTVLRIAVNIVLWLIPVLIAAAIVVWIVGRFTGGGQ